eukprot:290706_1
MTAQTTVHLNQQIKHLLNGYIRDIQTLLPQNKTCYIIPPEITMICMLFVVPTEYFKDYDDNLTVSGIHSNVITMNKDISVCVAFGGFIIDFKKLKRHILRWKFKIIQYDPLYYSSDEEDSTSTNWMHFEEEMSIGIDLLNNQNEKCKHSYSFGSDGAYYRKERQIVQNTDNAFGKDDTITMELDCFNKTLKYYLNDKDLRIAFDNIYGDEPYRMAMLIVGNYSVELVEFDIHKIHLGESSDI